MSRYLIYALSDPRTDEIRYIGKSTYGLKRARSHEYPMALSRNKGWSGNWIRSLHKIGLKPVIEVVEEFSLPHELDETEKFYIAYFRSLGFRLTNMTEGGEGTVGRIVGLATREKLRNANLGNKNALGKKLCLTDEQRKELAERARLRNSIPEIRNKMIEAARARLTGKKQSKEIIEKRMRKIRGKKFGPYSKERKEKFSEAAKIRKSIRSIVDSNGIEYKSAIEASEKLNIKTKSIYSVLSGARGSVFGMSFKYKERF